MKKYLMLVTTCLNFIKVSKYTKLTKYDFGFNVRIVHSGQHVDGNMVGVFFRT